MKKTLIALAAMAATSAFAQVTVYGIIDTNWRQQTTTVTAAGVSTDTKDNGVAAGSLSTPRWGIRVAEDLGGGLKANVNLESSLSPDSGAAPATAWARNATVGVSGGFGAIDLGVSISPIALLHATTDTNVLVGGTDQIWAQGGAIFPTDSVFYTSPNFGGLTVKALYGNNDAGSTGAFTNNKNTGLSLTYAKGPLLVGYAYDSIDNTSAASVNNTNLEHALAGTYDFGAAKLSLIYGTNKAQANTSLDTYTNQTETNVGVTVPFGAVTLLAAVGRNTKSTVTAGVETATATGSGNDYSVGLTYALSARTHAYGKVASNNNYSYTQSAGGANGQTVSLTTVGLRHIF